VQNYILVVGGQSSVITAVGIGMSCVHFEAGNYFTFYTLSQYGMKTFSMMLVILLLFALPSLSARAEFHYAMAVMDGFGDTDLIISNYSVRGGLNVYVN
jgi:hypothetical protein